MPLQGATNPNTAGGRAYQQALDAGLTLDEAIAAKDAFGHLEVLNLPKGVAPPTAATGLSPLGYAVAGGALGTLASMFAGYPWWMGTALGAGGGYVYGVFGTKG